METRHVSFPPRARRDLLLEGEVYGLAGPPCIVSHPHPMAGGTMHHPVVEALWRAAGGAGYRALRYNFRGVGASTGSLTSRSPLATDDLAGALDFLGGGPALALGYSYGARTTLHALHAGESIRKAALVALPTRQPSNRAAMSNLLLGRRVRTEEYVATPDADLVASAPCPVGVFAGALDPLFEAEEFRRRGIEPILFEGCNHFFSRRLGNQRPLDADLAALCEAVLAFLL